MTSRVSAKECGLRGALGERELCPGADCAFWEPASGGAEAGCAVELLAVPVGQRADLARHLLDLRLRLEEARNEAESRDAHRRFAELLNLNRE